MSTIEKTLRGDWRRVDPEQILGPTGEGEYLRRTSATYYDPATDTSAVTFEILSREQLNEAGQALGREVRTKVAISRAFGRLG